MREMKRISFVCACIVFTAFFAHADVIAEVEPNDSRETATPLVLIQSPADSGVNLSGDNSSGPGNLRSSAVTSSSQAAPISFASADVPRQQVYTTCASILLAASIWSLTAVSLTDKRTHCGTKRRNRQHNIHSRQLRHRHHRCDLLDRIVLSANDRYGDGDDITLKSVLRNGIFAPEDSYTVSTDIQIPKGISGEYWLFVHTDATNSVFEYIFATNNITQRPMSS